MAYLVRNYTDLNPYMLAAPMIFSISQGNCESLPLWGGSFFM